MEEQVYVPNEMPSEEEPPRRDYPTQEVNLTREEFVSFSLLQAKVNGILRRRMLLLVLSLCLFAMTAVLAVWTYLDTGTLDIPAMVATPIMLVPILFSFVIVPSPLKRRAEKSYDQRQAQYADEMYGILTVYPDRVEKVGSFSTAKIPFNGHSLFVEREDLLVFLNRFSPALVLPARCITPEIAAEIWRAADKLPVTNRRFISRFRPQGKPEAPPPEREPEETLWEQMVVYTPEESYRMARPILIQRFWKLSPMMAILCLLGAYLLGWDGSGNVIPCILYFFVCLGLQTLFVLVLPLNRMKKALPMLETKDLTIHLRITEKLLYFRTNESGETGLFWASDVAHVYDKDDMVEIEYKNGGFLFIPKRFIADFPAFSAIINRCRSKQ